VIRLNRDFTRADLSCSVYM